MLTNTMKPIAAALLMLAFQRLAGLDSRKGWRLTNQAILLRHCKNGDRWLSRDMRRRRYGSPPKTPHVFANSTQDSTIRVVLTGTGVCS